MHLKPWRERLCCPSSALGAGEGSATCCCDALSPAEAAWPQGRGQGAPSSAVPLGARGSRDVFPWSKTSVHAPRCSICTFSRDHCNGNRNVSVFAGE